MAIFTGVPYRETKNAFKTENDKGPIPLQKLKMLTIIYAPELKDEIDLIINYWTGEIAKESIKLMTTDISTMSKRAKFEKVHFESYQKIQLMIEDVYAKVAELINNLIN